MPLVMPNAVYMHIPRNAGSWIRLCLQRLKAFAGTTLYRLPHEDWRHHEPVSWLLDNRPDLYHRSFVWTSVRSPLAFLRTFWQVKLMDRITPVAITYAHFEQDIAEIVRYDPGCVMRYYKYFLTANGCFPAIDGFMRVENLVPEFLAMVARLGIPVSKAEAKKIANTGPYYMNVSATRRRELPLSRQVKQRVLEAEHEFLELFGYDIDMLIKSF